jgi:glucoamylase
MSASQVAALNGPGSQAGWTSSARTGVGTALSNRSNVWFTLSHGTFDEIYMADLNHEAPTAKYLREIADVRHTSITAQAPAGRRLDRWMFVSGTNWCGKFGAEGYYVRIAPTATKGGGSSFEKGVHVRKVSGADALALVLTVRYNDHGYGEHENGAPFDGTGMGRVWPLLTGERAHFELGAGRLISEQVWDSPDIPEHELCFGQPSGSEIPLVWAHAEYLKLQTAARCLKYLKEKVSPRLVWRLNHKIRSIPAGKLLRIERLLTAVIHWSGEDGHHWQGMDFVVRVAAKA